MSAESLPPIFIDRLLDEPEMLRGLIERHAPGWNALGKRVALDELHRNEINVLELFNGVDGNNVGMLEGRNRLGFARKTLAPAGVTRELLGQHLDSDLTVELGIAGAIHIAHPA